MRREEKRRKFHEAVVNTLYPPPSSPPQAEVEEKNSAYTSDKNFQVELIDPDDFLRSNSNISSDDGDNGNGSGIESQKLTRAQRKKLRKKKLKEDIARRRGIVGPLLPGTNNCDGNENSDENEEDSENVRQNAGEKCGGEQLACNNQNKIKHRRRAKKMARDKLKISSTENYEQDQSLKPNNNDEICDPDQNIKS